MEFHGFDIAGPVIIQPHKIGDDRGYFCELFRLREFEKHAPKADFVQENQSLSEKSGTIRGIHFQSHPAAQAKLVRCVAGKIIDFAVDLRRGSPTYGRWISCVLSPEEINQLWIPVGFGHAFCTLEPNSIISYRVTDYYSPQHDKGVAWDDPEIAIDWPGMADPETLSPKDRNLPVLSELPAYFTAEGS